ncbi:hypothetical protein ACFE04_019222 [Oxalis oulophora]
MAQQQKFLLLLHVVLFLYVLGLCTVEGLLNISAVGDPGMKRDGLRVALEAWNFCNEVAVEAPGMGSPRAADCFDLMNTTNKYYDVTKHKKKHKHGLDHVNGTYLNHLVSAADNKLRVGQKFLNVSKAALRNPDLYAAEKEVYLGSKCEVKDTPRPWQFWMVMLKNGNYDTRSALCPKDGVKVPPFSAPGRFPCFGTGCMNQPTVVHRKTKLLPSGLMIGGFSGTYDLYTNDIREYGDSSFYEVVWTKNAASGSWKFHHKLKTSKKYPWLMLYLRADATRGFSGGYHYDTRGMLKTLPESPNFRVKLTLDIKQGGGPKSQFYLIDMGSCWKNDGSSCDGDLTTDVTRYSEMIINPQTPAWCGPNNLRNCPPYHILPNNTKIYRNDTAHFPYGAYHIYCAPGNAKHLDGPTGTCDPYSNPHAQEIVQLLPHPVWGEYGFPTKKGEGWIGDARTWDLNVGGLSSQLYFYQDPGTAHAKRIWTSLDVGTEVFISSKHEVAEWTLSDFDLVNKFHQTTESAKLFVSLRILGLCTVEGLLNISAVGDPGMKRDGLRVALEAWNFCNEVAVEAPGMGSPRAADCFDLMNTTNKYYDVTKHKKKHKHKHGHDHVNGTYLKHLVSTADNKLRVGQKFLNVSKAALRNPDLYAAEKEVYLGSKCEVKDTPRPWQFWMVMLKNGNYDTRSALCPKDGVKCPPFSAPGRFPCFGTGCMNQPTVVHQKTKLLPSGLMIGGFSGTYDLYTNDIHEYGDASFYEVVWTKNVGSGSWKFHHKLKTSKRYPWLMLYLRADATRGFSGGYHYDTRGMLKTLPESPNFRVKLTLDIKQGGGPKSQFYLIDMGSCWKNDGSPCDGNLTTDVTRYSEMIINPQSGAWCGPKSLRNCPPYHILPNNTKIYKNDTAHFPYGAYHYYCSPGNAKYLDGSTSTCDPYSNPHAQEIVQLLPHPVWGEYGFPTKKGEGWIGDARTWDLNVGGLSSRLYFYQDPGTAPAKRIWTSLDVGTEVFISSKHEVAEWTLSDFDVILNNVTNN